MVQLSTYSTLGDQLTCHQVLIMGCTPTKCPLVHLIRSREKLRYCLQETRDEIHYSPRARSSERDISISEQTTNKYCPKGGLGKSN